MFEAHCACATVESLRAGVGCRSLFPETENDVGNVSARLKTRRGDRLVAEVILAQDVEIAGGDAVERPAAVVSARELAMEANLAGRMILYSDSKATDRLTIRTNHAA